MSRDYRAAGAIAAQFAGLGSQARIQGGVRGSGGEGGGGGGWFTINITHTNLFDKFACNICGRRMSGERAANEVPIPLKVPSIMSL